MSNYKKLRDKAFNATPRGLSFEILAANSHLVYHPPVNPFGKHGHYTVYNENSAICCPANEAMILYQIAEYLNPNTFIEIGSYAGWSSCHILAAISPTNQFIAVDNFSECKDPLLVANTLHNSLFFYDNADICEMDSTEFLKQCHAKADVIFIDGFHRDGKPLEDVKASLNCLAEDGYIILHDAWMPDVKVASEWLIKQGFNHHTFETDNYLTIYSKEDLSWCQTISV